MLLFSNCLLNLLINCSSLYICFGWNYIFYVKQYYLLLGHLHIYKQGFYYQYNFQPYFSQAAISVTSFSVHFFKIRLTCFVIFLDNDTIFFSVSAVIISPNFSSINRSISLALASALEELSNSANISSVTILLMKLVCL